MKQSFNSKKIVNEYLRFPCISHGKYLFSNLYNANNSCFFFIPNAKKLNWIKTLSFRKDFTMKESLTISHLSFVYKVHLRLGTQKCR